MKTILTKAVLVGAFAGLLLAAVRGSVGSQTVIEMKPDKRPHMVKAIDALRRAKAKLQAAAHERDYGGHRLGAITNVEEALFQANAALQEAKENDGRKRKSHR